MRFIRIPIETPIGIPMGTQMARIRQMSAASGYLFPTAKINNWRKSTQSATPTP